MKEFVDIFFSLVSSATQSCPTLCYHTDCGRPGFPVHHQLLDIFLNHHNLLHIQACVVLPYLLAQWKVKVTQLCLEWVAFPFPGDLPNPRMKPRSLSLQVVKLSHKGSPGILE